MISVIITAFQEPQTIGRAIRSFLNQKHSDIEIIVVCPDIPTRRAALSFSRKRHPIKVVQDKGKGKPVALNLALKQARGKVLVLSDGDVYVGKVALQELLKPFKDPSVGAVSGRPISLNQRNTFFGYWSHLLTAAAHFTRKERSKQRKFIDCSGYLYAMRSGLVRHLPSEALSEDAIVSHQIRQAGYRIAYAQQAHVFVKYPTNFKDWIKQKRRSIGGYFQIKTFVGKTPRMRSFLREALHGSSFAFRYATNLREWFWTIALFPARFLAWTLALWDTKVRKKPLQTIWKRVESTK